MKLIWYSIEGYNNGQQTTNNKQQGWIRIKIWYEYGIVKKVITTDNRQRTTGVNWNKNLIWIWYSIEGYNNGQQTTNNKQQGWIGIEIGY